MEKLLKNTALVAVGMAAMYGFMWLYSLAAYIDNL